jgi:RNA polymerase sigma factor (sigma-70 family)
MNENSCCFEKSHGRLKYVVAMCVKYYIDSCSNSLQDVGKEKEDMVQDLLVKVWLNWEKIKQLPTEEQNSLVYVIARNHMLNIAKHKLRILKYQRQYTLNQSLFCWHDDVLIMEGLKLYREAIEQLPPQERKVYMYYANDYGWREIASTVHRSENTVKNQLVSAGKTVRQYLNRNFDLNITEDGRRKLWRSTSMN